MSEYVYVNIESTSFKIWGYEFCLNFRNERTIIFLYRGKIGLPMDRLQKYKKIFDTSADAKEYLKTALKRKKYKKYLRVKYYPYFNLISRGRPLWELLRFIDVTGQQIDEIEEGIYEGIR